MSFESCHIEYDLSRRQRLVAHLRVWAPYLVGLVFIVGGGSATIIAPSISSWFVLLFVLPLWFARGFIVGLANVILVRSQHMDIIVNEKSLGFVTKRDRYWIFLDGIIRIQKYSKDTWTIFHHNGTVINIPVVAIEERYLDHMRTMAEKSELKDNLREDLRGDLRGDPRGDPKGDLKGDDSTIANLFGGIFILLLIFLCFVTPWWVHFRFGPWFGIGGAVFISFINAFFPVLNVNKFLFGIMHLNALVVIAVSIFRLIF